MWFPMLTIWQFDGLVQERCNSIANAMELRLSCTNPSIWYWNCPPGPWFNIKMSSYQYRKSHYGDKTILRPSYLHNGISYTGTMSSLYWIRALDLSLAIDCCMVPASTDIFILTASGDFSDYKAVTVMNSLLQCLCIAKEIFVHVISHCRI